MPFSKRTRFGSKRPGGIARLDLAPDLAPEVRMPPDEPVRRWEVPAPRREDPDRERDDRRRW